MADPNLENMTRAQLRARGEFLKKRIALSRSRLESGEPEDGITALDVARQAVGQGAGFGLGDEFIGTARGIYDVLSEGLDEDKSWGSLPGRFSDAISEGIDVERAINEKFEEENFLKSLVLQGAGGLLTGGLGAARSAIVRAPTVFKKITGGAKFGGGLGALAGVGYGEGNVLTAEGAKSRAISGLSGAALGAGTGALLPLAGKALTNLPVLSTSIKSKGLPFTKPYGDYKSRIKHEKRVLGPADRTLRKVSEAEGHDPDELKNVALQMNRAYKENLATPVDASVKLEGLAGRGLSSLQKTAEDQLRLISNTSLVKKLVKRNDKQADRLNKIINRSVSKEAAYGEGKTVGAIDKLNIKRAKEADAKYPGALDTEITVEGDLLALLSRPGAKKAFRNANIYAERLYNLQGRSGFNKKLIPAKNGKPKKYVEYWKLGLDKEISRLETSPTQSGPEKTSLRNVEYWKLGLDKEISRLETSPTQSGTELFNLIRLKDDFVKAIDGADKTGKLKSVRAAYAETSKEIQDILDGIGFMARKEAPESFEVIEKLNRNELERWKVGAAEVLRDRLRRTPDKDNKVPAIFNNESDRRKLKALLGRDAPKLFDELDTEDVFFHVGDRAKARLGAVGVEDLSTFWDDAKRILPGVGATALGSRWGPGRVAGALMPGRKGVREEDVATEIATRAFTPARKRDLGTHPRVQPPLGQIGQKMLSALQASGARIPPELTNYEQLIRALTTSTIAQQSARKPWERKLNNG
jgi:hypothetical protein